MNKNISINISGIIFHIEEDGYERLKGYLESITTYFSTFEDSKEIIADIESRIAEIFLEKLDKENKQVVAIEDVNMLISTMGTIADFEAIEDVEDKAAPAPTADTSSEESTSTAEEKTEEKEKTSSKKLYRDINRKVVGGVCSGLAHYFSIDPMWVRLLFLLMFFNFFLPGLSGAILLAYIILWIVVPGNKALEDDKKIKKMFRSQEDRVLGGVASGVAAYFGVDVTVIRLLFVLSIFLGGTGFFVYIILWIITPLAKTITEKMQMQGEPVTLSNIETNIKSNLNIKEDEESPIVKVLLFPFRLIALIINGIAKFIGPAANVFVDILRVFIGLLFSMLGLSTMTAIAITCAMFFGLTIGWWDWVSVDGVPVELFQQTLPGWAVFGLFLSAFIPALAITLGGISIMAKRWVAGSFLGWTLFGLWIISLVLVSYTVPRIIMDFRTDAIYTETKTYDMAGKTAILKLSGSDRQDWDEWNGQYEAVELRLRGHEDSVYKAVFDFEARGRDRSTALENAQMVTYDVDVQDSVFNFPRELKFTNDARFRVQNLDITLYIPYNQPFKMDESLARILRNTIYRNGYSTRQMEGNTWVFTDAGLKCTTCEEDDDYYSYNSGSGKSSFDAKPLTYDFKGYDEIEAGGIFKFYIKQGDYKDIEITGDDEWLERVKVSQSGGVLKFDIRGRNWDWRDNWESSDKIYVYISTPDLESIDLSGASEAYIDGFQANKLNINLSGFAQVDMDIDASKLDIEMDGGSKLTLRGNVNELKADVEGAASLDAFGSEARYVEVKAQGAARAKVNAMVDLKAEASGASTIVYQGEASTDIRRSGAGSVRKE
ncbi:MULTISPECIES: PspC domain-containing protein [unclassified Imperialibacter]|uniref:PspC domain-containing protein n=1 Tax=unclassified Imperialibacter TaxID=2629706 RepID=UPI0012521DB0|nr:MULTISPECIES: PspC domain-containing protein [unclassified Imperialibacter]CAD5273698.1 Phage shock protein C (PspC) family protein [Imperialibacter sp. 75]CAD5274066.1 Phage shock protein C (PspC) family protein [Imperialibacter sp. 89]VVT22706.1 Phage shock protein C (PspC) family protein [Imperialibacter sp. EC-SDR9]